jgi:transcriptional regulator with XRE-family HTH domain
MKIGVAVGLRLKGLLKEHNLTIYKLALNTGMYSQNIYSLVNGKIEDVKISTVCQFASGLNMTVNEFLDDPLFNYSNLDISDNYGRNN